MRLLEIFLKKKLIGGIVVTGGGAQLKHVKQLFEYVTGLDTRIGLPTEHLANTNELDKLASPMYSTGIGLVLNGFNNLDRKGTVGETSTATGTEKIARQTDKRRTGFFESLVEKGKSWFIEED